MFESLQPIQIFNAVTNILSMILTVPVLITVITYKKRAQRKYDDLDKHLDKILLLTNELYQSDVKEKANLLDQETISVRPTTAKVRKKTLSRV